ncbi:amidohydrolase family protein [Thermodesulfobacteriota bacterium]
MRIIDVHIHVGHRFEWTESAREIWMDSGPYVPQIFDAEERQAPGKYGDVIKEEGVVGGILLPEYSPQTAGVMPFERAREIHEAHPELIPFANLNPNAQDDPMSAFEEQLSQGARGLKIHAIHGFFFANDERLYPVYEKCEKEGLPVMFHAGTTLFRGAKMRYADPYTFDDVINDFPDMSVVLCHGGRGFWYHIAEFLAKHFANVYIDISGLPPKNLLNYFPSMKKFSHKFLFGTDFPGVPGIRKNYDALKGLIQDEAVLEQICYKNAFDLFGFWQRDR